MRQLTALALACTLLIPLAGCERTPSSTFNPALAGDFFPLAPATIWTYQVKSKSQQSTYVVTDKVIGIKYVPSLNVTGSVVEEYYNLDRGGVRPIIYVIKKGYLTRLSGLDYKKQDIQAPAWGRSEEGSFMPQRLLPDLTWDSQMFPFGHMTGAFDIKQTHHTFFESDAVVVPAGNFPGCIRIETRALYEGGTYANRGPTRLTYEDWYAPRVGLIKTVAFEGDSNGPETERVELLRYAAPSAAVGKSPNTAG